MNITLARRAAQDQLEADIRAIDPNYDLKFAAGPALVLAHSLDLGIKTGFHTNHYGSGRTQVIFASGLAIEDWTTGGDVILTWRGDQIARFSSQVPLPYIDDFIMTWLTDRA